ncbi:N-acetylmannosamine-6-phosphate 2-epimerase [Crocosphaera sp. UHCC 0190]|uniref:N-acetylmannosamine-6-phosphate 2-epimerase n=1 Tax=Crocosphaera sp. UHCC 0190 TaxID=3110246 RepID=UPI002B217B63|nr:N-acetylmannosamine-6-phosphate 2-epimerase [Crocosphaera sp. UHCC 0190]MEA5510824.1 N-acetylmannosamine-6-phosphate 2-epimerase [Crocosphaera sp. UHCC 0190]
MTIPKSCLIVSCQAPPESPLHNPIIIAAMAEVAINQGAAGVRIDTPAHVKKVREKLPQIPIIGLWKQNYSGSDVYITPCFNDAVAIAEAGADIIAIDGTLRNRPQGETLADLIDKIHQQLGKLVMADVDTIENAIASEKAGADFVGTTLYGYTKDTQHLSPPGYSLLIEMTQKLRVPLIAEGGISTPEDAKKALNYGAFSVVVGTAITGIDLKVKAFQSVFMK